MADRPVIAYVGGFEFPDKNAAASRVLAVANLFADAGFDLALVGVDRDPSRGPASMVPVDIDLPYKASVWSIGYPRTHKEWFHQIISCDQILTRLENTYGSRLAAVVFYNYPAISQFRASRSLQKKAIPAVADLTEWYEDGPWTSVRTAIKNLDTRLRMHWANRRMSALITTSPLLTRFYKKEGRPNMELPTLLSRAPGFADHQRSPRKDIPQLLFAGSGFDPATYSERPEMLKDRLDWCIELLHRAHKKSVRFKFEIFGVTQDDFLAICPHLTRAISDLKDDVTFHGRQPRDQVLATLWDADYAFFLRKSMRSTDAGFPTKLSEALTHGIPVLTNPMENISPFVIPGENGDLIDLTGPDGGIGTLIDALQRSPKKREALYRKCVGQQPFSAGNYQKRTQSFLQTLFPDRNI